MQWRCPSVCLFIRLSPEMRSCRAMACLAQQCNSAGGCEQPQRCAAEPVRPVADILMAVGAYHVDHSGRTELSYIHVNDTVWYLPRSVAMTT